MFVGQTNPPPLGNGVTKESMSNGGLNCISPDASGIALVSSEALRLVQSGQLLLMLTVQIV